jgi:lipoate-protein ligase A
MRAVATFPRLSVARFRTRQEAVVVIREVEETWLVLGSAQGDELVGDPKDLRVARRRGGGGAVLLPPEDAYWIDLWIPHGAAAHRNDVRALLEVAGQAWVAALSEQAVEGLVVASPEEPAQRAAVCFAGIGHGEVVTQEGRKLVGVTAWRSREGALLQTAVYRRRELSLPDLLELSPAERKAARGQLESGVTDLAEVSVEPPRIAALGRGLARALSAEVEVAPPDVDDQQDPGVLGS